MKQAATLLALSAGVAALLVHREQPPVAHTGGFGEKICAECHIGEELNAPGGQLTLLGVPKFFEPGRHYTLTVRLRRPPLAIGGFQLAARFEDGPLAGRQAGVLRSKSERVRVAEAEGIQYAHHTLYSVTATDNTLHWRVTWQAPARPGRVVFHVAANASNDDASNLGDHIYTATARTFARPQK